MQLNSQEIETFQKLGKNSFPVILKWGLEKAARVEWMLALIK